MNVWVGQISGITQAHDSDHNETWGAGVDAKFAGLSIPILSSHFLLMSFRSDVWLGRVCTNKSTVKAHQSNDT